MHPLQPSDRIPYGHDNKYGDQTNSFRIIAEGASAKTKYLRREGLRAVPIAKTGTLRTLIESL